MTIQHWLPPDIRGDILAAALRSDAAAPLVVHVRPEVHARMGTRPLCAEPAAPAGQGTSIPVVVDDQLPRAPGYEIHRVPPAAPVGPFPELPLEAADHRAADTGTSVAEPCTALSRTAGSRRGRRSPELRWLRNHLRYHRVPAGRLAGTRVSS